ncbi:MAG: ribosome-associated translation inhibitor RaiA [Oscillospiraceae bacterium]
MNITFTGRKVKIKDSFKQLAEKRLQKLIKFFGDDFEVNVEVTVEKKYQKVEVTATCRGFIFRAEREKEEMEEALDLAIDNLYKQIIKNKSKLEKKGFKKLEEDDYDDYDQILEEDDFKIIKTKTFNLKPMNIEEAILQMNQLDHNFFVFLNCDNNNINIVYKRKDNDYAVLEPQIN